MATSEPGGHQERLALALGLGQHIGALRGEVLGLVLGPQRRQALAAQRQDRGGGGLDQRDFPGLGGLHRVGGAEDQHVGRGAQHGEVFDRLVRRAVLAQPDAVMGHHVLHRHPISAESRIAGARNR
jgi:hypothetical protein